MHLGMEGYGICPNTGGRAQRMTTDRQIDNLPTFNDNSIESCQH